MPSVQDYVKSGHLTKKQGDNLPPTYALKVGANNKKKGRKPKPSLPKAHDPSYRFHAVTINKNHAAAKHTDQNNKGHSWIIGLGNYTGGELVFTDKSSPYYGTHNIKNKWLKFVGDTEHYVKPFKGERYTLVYYNWK
jgi:hypothetical protein